MSRPDDYILEKTRWQRGPWDTEPDRLQWTDDATGFPCLIVRSWVSGSLCGYVAVNAGHPWHGLPYNAPGPDVVEVHGGLTYSDRCDDLICHVPEPGASDDVWWFGFDTAHAYDFSPAIAALGEMTLPQKYRDLEYVRGNCTWLAAQLARER